MSKLAILVLFLSAGVACSSDLAPSPILASARVTFASATPTAIDVRDEFGTRVGPSTIGDGTTWSAAFAVPQHITVQYGACALQAIDLVGDVAFTVDPSACTRTP